MSSVELASLRDPFAQLVLSRQPLPLDLRSLLAILDEHNSESAGLPTQISFLVGEGGLIPWTPQSAAFDRGLRFVVARGVTAPTSQRSWELFVSTAPPFDGSDIFLQVLSWDPIAGAFQFYERRDGSWFWAGSSWDALEPETRGRGPFDSHVNGSMVMKELRIPWLHWSSMSQSIPPEVFAPGDLTRTDPLYTGRSGGETLESIVKTGVDRWSRSRIDKVIGAGGIVDAPDRLLRHVLTTTTVNIASAPQPSAGPLDEKILLPLSFFFDAISLLDLIGLAPEIAGPPFVTRGRYLASAARIGLHLRDARQLPPFDRPGDVFFAWAVPEPAFEDTNVLDHLIRRGCLSRKTAAAMLMVDFSNPIGSVARETLMQFVPTVPTLLADLEEIIVRAAANTDAESPAGDFTRDLTIADGDWAGVYEARLAGLMAAVQTRLNDDAGLDDLMRLADSRRRAFRRHPLAEFDLSLPWTDTPNGASFLRLQPDGEVTEVN